MKSHSDTRRESRRQLESYTFSKWRTLFLSLASLLLACGVALWPDYAGLTDAARWALFILILCASLWITEAIPAFAVSLLVIGLEIAILGKPGGVFAQGPNEWERFIATWGSPLIWLFFGGFVLSASAEKTGLDRWMALRAMSFFGNRPAFLLLGIMLLTSTLSMFMSNTATSTLMVAVLSPLLFARPQGDPIAKSLFLGVCYAANLGGMGTLIGTPPNAIAAGALADVAPVDFTQWMLYAIPPMAILLALAWILAVGRYLGTKGFAPLKEFSLADPPEKSVPPAQQSVVIVTFFATILLWMTSSLHGIPSTVISFVPICVLTATGVLDADDIRKIPWDILLLIAGGLSLGVAVSDTGLATWLVAQFPFAGLPPLALAIAFGYVGIVMSNLMSNTAAANILIPLVLAVVGRSNPQLVVPVALSVSAAMCLPISTPPNAIVYGTRRLATGELMLGGLVLGLVTPPIVVAWTSFIQRYAT